MKFYQSKLANGLTVIGEQRDTAVSVAMGFFVRAGARDETPELSGVSHFLEHMMFKGTEKRSALDITYQLSAVGAQANAYTSEENTVYYLAVLPEYLASAFDILSDMLRPSLDQKEFDTEKNVILDEIAMYQDRPTHVLFERSLKEYFGEHPAGNSVLGTTDSIAALTRDQMNKYFEQRYSPSNIVLAFSGNFDWEKVLELAENHCAAWENYDVSRALPAHSPMKASKEIRRENLNLAHTCLLGPGPSAKDQERYASSVLCCILGDSTGSKAYWQLIDKGLAEAASVGSDEMDGTGLLYAYVSAAPEAIGDVSEILRQIMLEAKSFDDDDFTRAKTKIATRLVLRGESSMRRLMAVGNDWIYREEYTPLSEELSRIQAVTKADIEDCLQKYSFAPTTQVTLLPA